MEFQNKVVWVTGASSGIGRALCLALDKKGARLIVSGRNVKALEELVKECSISESHRILAFDLAEPSKCESVVAQAWGFHQGVDILVNNGGISQRSLAMETSIEVDRRVMEVDYFGAVALTKALLPRLVAEKKGTIINIASLAGKMGTPMRSAYSGAKHALIGFMDCLRAEVARYGINVINVCPGFVNTDISRNALTGDMSAYEKMDDEIAQGIQVDQFVEILLGKLQSTKREIVIARGRAKTGYQIRRLLPNLYHWLLPRIYNRTS